MNKKLTKKQAQKIARKLIQKGEFAMRSCWNCNGAHEHLKKVDVLNCFGCGHWYYRGIDLMETKK